MAITNANKEIMDAINNNNTTAGRLSALLGVADRQAATIKDLRKLLSALEGVATIHKCKSCDGYYVEGYVCNCGRDNSYSDEEWERRNF